MECPVCFNTNCGAYIFIECGHSTCPECIVRIHDTTGRLNCPLCRMHITSAPIIIQACASQMPDGLVRTMAQHFQTWFPQNRTNSNSIYALTGVTSAYTGSAGVTSAYTDLLSVTNSAEMSQRYGMPFTSNRNVPNINTPLTSQVTPQLTQHQLNELYNYNSRNELNLNNAAQEEWSIITNSVPYTARIYYANDVPVLENRRFQLPNDWSFIPLVMEFSITLNTTFIERCDTNHRTRFRRVVICIGNANTRLRITNLENSIYNSISSRFPNENLNLYSEIGMRNNITSICAHSLSDDVNSPSYSPNTLRNIRLVCRGAWTHDGRVGCRWFVDGLYNNIA